MVTKRWARGSHTSTKVTRLQLTGWRPGEYSFVETGLAPSPLRAATIPSAGDAASRVSTKEKSGRKEDSTRTSLAPGCNRPGSSRHQGLQRSIHAVRRAAPRRGHRARRAGGEGKGGKIRGGRDLARLQLHAGRGILDRVI